MPTLEELGTELSAHAGTEASSSEKGQRISVLDPRGRRGTVPMSQVRQAMAQGYRLAPPPSPRPLSGFFARLGIPLGGSMLGAGLGALAGEAIDPLGGGVPGALIGRTLGAGLAEAGREQISQGRVNPVEAAGTGLGFGVAPGLGRGIEKGIGLLPLVRSVVRPGTVLGAATTTGLTGGAIAAGQAAAEAAPLRQLALRQRGQAAGRVFPEAALISGLAGGVFHTAVSWWRARTGAPRLAADQAVDRQAEQIALEYRRGGSLHDDSLTGLHDMGQWAYQPMRDVARRIPTPITLDDVNESLQDIPELARDPLRLQQAQQTLRSIWPTDVQSQRTLGRSSRHLSRSVPRQSINAEELINISSQATGKLPRGVVGGTRPAGGDDLSLIDVKHGIATHIEKIAPPEVRGEAQVARARYADFVQGVRDPFFEFLQPRSSPQGATNKAVDTVRSIASGKASQSDMRAFSRIALLADEAHGRVTPEELWELTTAHPSTPPTSPLTPQAQGVLRAMRGPLQELARRTGEEQFAVRARNILQRAPIVIPIYALYRQLLKELNQ